MIPQPSISSHANPIERAGRVRDSLPEGGLFAEKSWRISPEAFPLSKREVKTLVRLGPILLKFQQAADLIYRRSRKGSLPGWVAEYLDRGKPESLLEMGLGSPVAEAVPRVIRPDLILTENGFTASELDSVPGGIGLTAWLGQAYSTITPQAEIVGGADGMFSGFSSIFKKDAADILVSEEAGNYRPEMEWFSERLEGDFQVADAETYKPGSRDVYRFFELFDLPNVRGGAAAGEAAAAGAIDVTSPFKPWLEEKMWSALFWSHPLKEVWRRELRDGNWRRLREIFPMSWIVDPAEVPHHAVIPGLGIQHFSEMKQFSQAKRDLVLKLSGFNERAWGSRSVTIGSDASQVEWGEAVDEALANFATAPFVLQRFHNGRLVEHPWLNPETGEIEVMEGRVRLCPYYFVGARDREVRLGGVLATICPSDKKILHGMSDAILVPCRLEA